MTHTITAANIAQMNPLDVHALYELRVEVFINEHQAPYKEIDSTAADSRTLHLLAWDDATRTLDGTARIFPSTFEGADVIQFGRFAIAKKARGTGLGAQIMDAALRLAEATAPGQSVFLNARTPLVDYYSGYGFDKCGEPFEESRIPHQPMILRRNRSGAEY